MDTLVILSVIGAIVTMINQTLIRKKNWLGWALALPNICFFMYVNWRAGSYGYAFILGPFWFVNAILAIREWRASSEPQTPGGGDEPVDRPERAATR
jgi:hypothetical protein